MNGQLQLLELEQTTPGVLLTPRQSFALRLVVEAGTDGILAEEVGAAWDAQRGKHSLDARCRWCGSNGQQVLKALQKKGLVKYRRKTAQREGGWVAIGATEQRASSQDDGWEKLLEAGF